MKVLILFMSTTTASLDLHSKLFQELREVDIEKNNQIKIFIYSELENII